MENRFPSVSSLPHLSRQASVWWIRCSKAVLSLLLASSKMSRDLKKADCDGNAIYGVYYIKFT